MAKSKYEYVKSFERNDSLLPSCWILVRIDGQNFHRFSAEHNFEKPNDLRALNLMNHCAQHVLKEFNELVLGYGESDEYSFLFPPNCNLYKRRESKLSSMIASLFSSCYVFFWHLYFKEPLKYPPSFDGRAVLYPNSQIMRDYFSWRQADCHINNLYNSCFWAIVKSGKTEQEAEKELIGTNSGTKNEILFQKFGINYNTLPEIFRKGSVVLQKSKIEKRTEDATRRIEILHCDIIQIDFWKSHFPSFC